MSNLIVLPGRQADPSPDRSVAQLVRCFARHRRTLDDVFWMKENAELLAVVESGGTRPSPTDLTPYQGFYAEAEARLGFFPQYYRFFLSICIDLEELGMDGAVGERIAARVLADDMAEGELSDLQRLEVRRHLGRRGLGGAMRADWVEERVRRFMRRAPAFAIPNRTAVYNLTHAVFYLSDYGRCDPRLGADELCSLRYAGTLALLEKNVDLLAEICIALRWSGAEPPPFWENWIAAQLRQIRILPGVTQPLPDDYHPFLMANWQQAVAGALAFAQPIPQGRVVFRSDPPARVPLRDLSHLLLRLHGRGRKDWQSLRTEISAQLPEEVVRFIGGVEQSSPWFEEFFDCFARAGRQGAAA